MVYISNLTLNYMGTQCIITLKINWFLVDFNMGKKHLLEGEKDFICDKN